MRLEELRINVNLSIFEFLAVNTDKIEKLLGKHTTQSFDFLRNKLIKEEFFIKRKVLLHSEGFTINYKVGDDNELILYLSSSLPSVCLFGGRQKCSLTIITQTFLDRSTL